MWRRNKNYRGGARSGGSCIGENYEYKIKNFDGINGYSQISHDDVSEFLHTPYSFCSAMMVCKLRSPSPITL